MSHDFSSIREYALASGGHLLVAPTAVRDLVVIEGSVYGGPSHFSGEKMLLPALAASLLDAGTATKSKEVIRNALAAKGISLSFGAAGDRTYLSAQCFPEHVGQVFTVIVECLTQAAFPEAEIKNVNALAQGALAEEKSNTRARADRALRQALYAKGHMHYVGSIEEEEVAVRALRRADFVAYRRALGRGGLVLAVAGDVDPRAVQALAERACKKLLPGTDAPAPKASNTKKRAAEQTLVAVADKANIDTRLGVTVPVTLEHPLYLPLVTVLDALGGGFTSHLMQTIRDRDGLTYGVYAALAGARTDLEGYVKIAASFTPDRFYESVAKLRAETALFLSTGITDTVLEETKARMIGSYVVSLATTQGLAAALHRLGVEGKALSYLAEYPDRVRRISLTEALEAAALISVEALTLTAAGTIPKK